MSLVNIDMHFVKIIARVRSIVLLLAIPSGAQAFSGAPTFAGLSITRISNDHIFRTHAAQAFTSLLSPTLAAHDAEIEWTERASRRVQKFKCKSLTLDLNDSFTVCELDGQKGAVVLDWASTKVMTKYDSF